MHLTALLSRRIQAKPSAATISLLPLQPLSTRGKKLNRIATSQAVLTLQTAISVTKPRALIKLLSKIMMRTTKVKITRV